MHEADKSWFEERLIELQEEYEITPENYTKKRTDLLKMMESLVCILNKK